MNHLILIDEPALRECVESNIYQSTEFEAGRRLASSLKGEKLPTINVRIVPKWKKEVLFLLQSKVPTGYLLIASNVFSAFPTVNNRAVTEEETLQIFQRICRFALKRWNNLSYSASERWQQSTDCGVVFPFPFSRQTGFRVTLRKGYDDSRYSKRHGTKHLFAFAAGVDVEAVSKPDHQREYNRAFEELTSARTELEVVITEIQKTKPDVGFKPLVLSAAYREGINYYTYDQWLNRLTVEQKTFVASDVTTPQRVEGPAGTGKTLTLMLRAFFLCRKYQLQNEEYRVLFVAHSEATKQSIQTFLDILGEPGYHALTRENAPQTIELDTLQSWCGRLLGPGEVSNSQFLDKDALAAKEMRRMIIKEIVVARKQDLKTFEYLSPACREFFLKEDGDYVSELLQHEIGVQIKGRASEELETYLSLPLLKYCLPLETALDKHFVFGLYREYREQLRLLGSFDTDDIVLTTLGRLDTPIWRRRKITEGYDTVIIDETHLFNLNELSIFHHILRKSESFIAFSIDRSQAPGERGITTSLVKEVLTNSGNADAETKTQIVFRSSPAIVRLAEAITSAGATLFTTFENPLAAVSSVISASDEALAREPIYWECRNDQEMCRAAIERYNKIRNELKFLPSDILIVATTEDLLRSLEGFISSSNVKYVRLLQRGDLQAIYTSDNEKAVILSHPDFVGGLEFKAVLIVGVDEGRMPPTENSQMAESRHFVEFKACNRLYVTVTRARLVVEIFYSSDRGQSSILKHALTTNALKTTAFDS